MKNQLEYAGFRALILFARIIPFSVLYIFSDCLYFLIYYIVGYRKKIVIQNLSQSFPEKNTEEIRRLSKNFYHRFCDISVETLKGFSVPKSEYFKRFPFEPTIHEDRFYEEGRDTIALTSHFYNWEWIAQCVDFQVKHHGIVFFMPLRNHLVDDYITRKRGRWGTELVPAEDARHAFQQEHDKPVTFVMIADQRPHKLKRAKWIDFLEQETAFAPGPDLFARKYNMPVIFYDVYRIKRGYYKVKPMLLAENPRELESGEITRRYAARLEEAIRREPEAWLWTHRRWRTKRSEVADQVAAHARRNKEKKK